jgi:glycosyltransferase involved in cell wall biosynthesis
MHVLITADTIGGVWTYARELVIGLIRHGVRVTLVSFGEIPSPRQMEWLAAFPEVDFRPTGFPLEWMQEAPESLAASTTFLRSVVDEVNPDLLHFNQYCYGSIEVDLPRLVVAHSDVISWWVAVHGEQPRETKWLRWYRQVVQQGLLCASAVVAPSEWMLEALASYYLLPGRTRVIYNGRSPALLNPYVTKENCVLSVGRLWDGGKQVSLLTRMEPPLPVYIAGSTQHPGTSPHDPPEHPQDSKIRLLGQIPEEELRRWFGLAAIYAAPSRYEPFGLAPLEAALSRCALVLNDIPSFHEIWGENARYFHYDDATSLAQTLRELAQDREARMVYGNLAWQHARRHFTADSMVEQYVGLYRSLTSAEVRVA